MELLLIFGLVTTGLLMLVIIISSVAFVLGFIVGLWIYGPFYHDQSAESGQRAASWLREWTLWRVLKRFYDHRIIQVGEAVKPEEPVFYTCHPHGICALSVGFTFACRDFVTKEYVPNEHVYMGALKLVFYIPILRDLYLALGCVHVSWKTIESHLRQGHSIAIVPGGVNEMGLAVSKKRDERFLERAYAAHFRRIATKPRENTRQSDSSSIRHGFFPQLFAPTKKQEENVGDTLTVEQASALPIAAKQEDEVAIDMPLNVTMVPVYCHNEDDIYMTWHTEWRWVTAIRTKCARWMGYPFPTLFLGPWPWKPLRTYLGPPHRLLSLNETLESYKARYWQSLELLKNEAHQKESEPI